MIKTINQLKEYSKDNVKEWSVSKRWNPFNSYKLLAQVYKWREIEKGNKIPSPTLVTIDPINICNQSCFWCNAEAVLSKNNNKISKKSLGKISDFLKKWKVEAVCIAGGGEPLLHPNIDYLINKLINNGIEVGVVTNGTDIDNHIESLSKCTWVGVSVDAGTSSTFRKIKGKDNLTKILCNIKELSLYAKNNNCKLGENRLGNGVTYKYLLHPYNINEVLESVKLAKKNGCRNFHLRPMGIPWNKLDTDIVTYTETQLLSYKNQIEKARELEDENFGVYGVTHKFTDKFGISNSFSNCYAIFMTGVFMPSTDNNENHFTFGVCCDRRGDSRLELATNISSPSKVAKLWGSNKHWKIFNDIDINKCPRCTYQPHNQIYEHVIKNDSMTYKFI